MLWKEETPGRVNFSKKKDNMKWIEAKVFFESDEPSWAMEIISDIFTLSIPRGLS
jgi:hypothetical protein